MTQDHCVSLFHFRFKCLLQILRCFMMSTVIYSYTVGTSSIVTLCSTTKWADLIPPWCMNNWPFSIIDHWGEPSLSHQWGTCRTVLPEEPSILFVKTTSFAKMATRINFGTFAKFGDLDKILPKLAYSPKSPCAANYRQFFAIFVVVCISRHKCKYVLILKTLNP